ncbi:hypothetical protein FOZ61_002078, partial [Perkinsus olseni]
MSMFFYHHSRCNRRSIRCMSTMITGSTGMSYRNTYRIEKMVQEGNRFTPVTIASLVITTTMMMLRCIYLYLDTFNRVMSLPANITTPDECDTLRDVLHQQAMDARDVIRWVQIGHRELKHYKGLEEMNRFLDDKLFTMRIGTRLLI